MTRVWYDGLKGERLEEHYSRRRHRAACISDDMIEAFEYAARRAGLAPVTAWRWLESRNPSFAGFQARIRAISEGKMYEPRPVTFRMGDYCAASIVVFPQVAAKPADEIG